MYFTYMYFYVYVYSELENVPKMCAFGAVNDGLNIYGKMCFTNF